MKTDLKNKKEKLENYIRSIGYETTGLELKSDQAIIDQAIIDSYKQDEKKDLVSLIDIIEVTSKDGKYEEIDLDKVEMIEIGDTLGGNRDEKAKTDFLEVDYKMKTLAGFLNLSKEQIDDGMYNLDSFLGNSIAKLERKTMNKGIGKILTLATAKSIASINDIKDLVALVNPEREVSIVVTNSLFIHLEKMVDSSGLPILKVNKVNGTSETFYTDHFVVVDDTTLGNAGDKLAFVGDLKNYAKLFKYNQTSVKWVTDFKTYSERLALYTRFDVKKVQPTLGYFATWN